MANKALLVGINYVGTSNELRGCANDIEDVKILLTQNGFAREAITLVSDAHPEARIAPSRKNILAQLTGLVKGSKEGDLLVFHYSGHGTQERDSLLGGDEIDRKDEVICPASGGFIKDDELKKILTELPKGVRLLALMDCCHSGSILDLTGINTNSNERLSAIKIQNGFAAMISGCKDDEVSADALVGKEYQGAMTSAFMAMVNERYKSFQSVLDICFSNSVKRMTTFRNNMWDWLDRNKYPQRPNVGCEGTLPAVMPMLRSYQKGGHSLRGIAARNAASYVVAEVPLDHARGGRERSRSRRP